jgi:hypothetical protein
MIAVITEFEADIEIDQQAGRHAYGKTQDIDKREDAVAPEISKGDLEIVLEHNGLFFKSV